MSKPDAWMPFFVGDYLADTARLTTLQHGAYLLLMLDYWRNGAPPDDAAVLSQITRLTARDWAVHGPVLQRLFSVREGRWFHKRIEAELADAAERKQKAVEKAAKAANARWSGDAPSNAPSNAPSIGQAMLEQCPSPSPSPIEANPPSEDRQQAAPDCPHADIIALYHETLPACQRVKVWDGTRAANLRSRWREDPKRQSLDYWRRVFLAVGKSDFLMGRAQSRDRAPFVFSLDWLVKASNFAKFIEGRYTNRD